MQPPPLSQRVEVVVAVVLARRLLLRVRSTVRGAIQRLHGWGPDREQQLGRQMLQVAATACSLPAHWLITVPQPRPVCAPRSRAAAPPHPCPVDPAELAAASLSPC